MATPPWLQITPQTFLGAMEAGTAAGQRERAKSASESEAADRLRLAYDSLASHERMQNQTAQDKMEANRAAIALRQSQMEGLQSYRQQELERKKEAGAELGDYRQARLAQIDRAQDISEEKAAAMVKRGEASVVDFPELPGQKFIRNPSGSVFRVSGAAREPSISLDAEGKPKGYSGPISNPVIRELMGTNAPVSLGGPAPAAPEAPKPSGPGFLSRAWNTLTGGDAPTGLPQVGNLPQAGDRVRVKSPEGKVGTIPADQLDDALAAGWTRM